MARRLHLVPHGAHCHRAPDQRVWAHQAGAALPAHYICVHWGLQSLVRFREPARAWPWGQEACLSRHG